MDKLTKDQKDEYATSFAALALYDVSYTYERNDDHILVQILLICKSSNTIISLHIFPTIII